MNGFDIALIVLAGLLVVVGLLKGIVRILVGLAALAAAFVVAARFHGSVADRLEGASGMPPEAAGVVAYVALFLAVMLAGSVIAWMTRRLLEAAMLSWADRALGAGLGLATAVLATALLVLPAIAYTPAGPRWLAGSRLAPYVAVVADIAVLAAPDDLAARYRDGIVSLRKSWHDGVRAVERAGDAAI